MQRNTPSYNEMIREVASGQLTRKQACEKYNLDYAKLGVWLHREGVKTGHKLAGKAAENHASMTPDKVEALNKALAKVMAGEISVYSAAKADPLVNIGTLRTRVDAAKKAAGIPKGLRPGRPRTLEQAVQAVKEARAALARAEAELAEFTK